MCVHVETHTHSHSAHSPKTHMHVYKRVYSSARVYQTANRRDPHSKAFTFWKEWEGGVGVADMLA